jgi:hypothetical protein
MSPSLPVRGRVHNARPFSAAPAAFVVLATRAAGADSCEVLLRDLIACASIDQLIATAELVRTAIAASFGAGVDVQVFDRANVPVLLSRTEVR